VRLKLADRGDQDTPVGRIIPPNERARARVLQQVVRARAGGGEREGGCFVNDEKRSDVGGSNVFQESLRRFLVQAEELV